MSLAETRNYQTKSNLQCLLLFNYPSLSQKQITFLGPLEWRNLFGPKDKVAIHEKLVFRKGVHFLFLFVLMDVILLNLDLQKKDTVEISSLTLFHLGFGMTLSTGGGSKSTGADYGLISWPRGYLVPKTCSRVKILVFSIL